MEVDDLFVDLADGIKLLKLLEIISGEKLGKPNNGRMRVHKIENVNKSLAFLHTKVNDPHSPLFAPLTCCMQHFWEILILWARIVRQMKTHIRSIAEWLRFEIEIISGDFWRA